MDFISARDAALKWGLKLRAVQNLCASGRIAGAAKFERSWMIPADAARPVDLRLKRGGEPAAFQPELSAPFSPISAYRPFLFAPGSSFENAASFPQGSAQARSLCAQKAYLQGRISQAAELAAEILNDGADGESELECHVLLALNALYCGSLPDWKSAVGKIRCTGVPPKIRELTLGLLGISVYDLSLIPPWLAQADFSRLPPDSLPLAWYVYVKWLYISKKYEAALYAALPLIEQCRAGGVLVAEVQLCMMAAALFHTLEDEPSALRMLNRTLDLAMPHGFIFTFIEYRRDLDTLLEQAMTSRGLLCEWEEIRRRSKGLFAGWAMLYGELTGKLMSPHLTAREHEALKYAARNLSIAESAARMGVAESSVKSYLNAAYGKLGISSRAELQSAEAQRE